jgi:ArsR family transcriptional regulator, arsenate/arsenite/antimonite-responsive transcriptional repressor
MKQLCDILKALSNETRLKIYKLLIEQRRPVSEIMDKLKLSQPRTSQSLSVLENAGLVESERNGRWMIYSAKEPKAPLVKRVHGLIKTYPKKLPGTR